MLTRSWKSVVCLENPSLLNFPKYMISRHTAEIRRVSTHKIVKPYYRERDPARISLCHRGKKSNILVHRAYLLTFHGPPPLDEKGRPYTADHINGNQFDNSPSNLTWSSIVVQNAKRRRPQRHVRYLREFHRDPDEQVRRFPSTRNCWEFTSKGRILFNGKLRVNEKIRRDGYRVVKIDGTQYYVHRIIAALFLDYSLDDPTHIIMHVNHNKLDCAVDNLQIGTHKENVVAEMQRRKELKADVVEP